MSTSLLYQAFGIRGYQYRSHRFFRGPRMLQPSNNPERRYRCPECGSAAVHAQGHKDRFLQTVPIGLKPTFLLVKVPRVICFQCEHTRQVKVPFADPRRTYTHAFERYALELSKVTTIQDAARHLDVSWDIIKDIQKRNLQRRFGKPKLKNLKEIAIDEIAIGKGHAYFMSRDKAGGSMRSRGKIPPFPCGWQMVQGETAVDHVVSGVLGQRRQDMPLDELHRARKGF